jgi:hypothetical protein
MGAQSTFIIPDTLRSIDSATFTGTYQAVGTPLLHGARIVRFVNNSTVLVTISWDGINANEVVRPGSDFTLNVSANREVSSDFFEVRWNTQFYVMGTAGTGLFYISCYYGNISNPVVA